MRTSKFLPLLFILPGLLFYLPSLKYYFAQDDFIHLYSAKANSLTEFLNFFNSFHQYPDIFFFRPLTTQTYFFINHSIFGLDPLPFHLEALLLHFLNSLLLYILVLKIWKQKPVALISTFLYSISAVHFLSLFYISAFQQLGRTFFTFLAILLFLKLKETNKLKYLYFSILAFIGALLSKEISITLPILLIPVLMILEKNANILRTIKDNFKILITYFGISMAYLAIRFIGFLTIFNQGGYQYDFSILSILLNLKWYVLWTFGLPEIISTYPSIGIVGVSQFIADFQFGLLMVILFVAILICMAVGLISTRRLPPRLYLAATLFFLITLSPVLILSDHSYPHYLDLSFLVIFPLLVKLFLDSSYSKTLGVFALFAFAVLQFLSINLSENSHWSTHRSEVSKYYYQQLKTSHPELPNQTTLIFEGTKNQTKELSVALAKDYSLKVWYPNLLKQVIYNVPTKQFNIEGTISIPITKY